MAKKVKYFNVPNSLQSICVNKLMLDKTDKEVGDIQLPELIVDELKLVKARINYNRKTDCWFNILKLPGMMSCELKNLDRIREIEQMFEYLFYGKSIEEDILNKYLVVCEDYPIFKKYNENLNETFKSIVFGKIKIPKKPIEYGIFLVNKFNLICFKCDLPKVNYHMGCKFCDKSAIKVCKCQNNDYSGMYKYDLLHEFLIENPFEFEDILDKDEYGDFIAELEWQNENFMSEFY